MAIASSAAASKAATTCSAGVCVRSGAGSRTSGWAAHSPGSVSSCAGPAACSAAEWAAPGRRWLCRNSVESDVGRCYERRTLCTVAAITVSCTPPPVPSRPIAHNQPATCGRGCLPLLATSPFPRARFRWGATGDGFSALDAVPAAPVWPTVAHWAIAPSFLPSAPPPPPPGAANTHHHRRRSGRPWQRPCRGYCSLSRMQPARGDEV